MDKALKIAGLTGRASDGGDRAIISQPVVIMAVGDLHFPDHFTLYMDTSRVSKNLQIKRKFGLQYPWDKGYCIKPKIVFNILEVLATVS